MGLSVRCQRHPIGSSVPANWAGWPFQRAWSLLSTCTPGRTTTSGPAPAPRRRVPQASLRHGVAVRVVIRPSRIASSSSCAALARGRGRLVCRRSRAGVPVRHPTGCGLVPGLGRRCPAATPVTAAAVRVRDRDLQNEHAGMVQLSRRDPREVARTLLRRAAAVLSPGAFTPVHLAGEGGTRAAGRAGHDRPELVPPRTLL